MIALVAIVEPCLKAVISCGWTPAFCSASSTPWMNSGGVDGVLTLISLSVSSSYATRSVNVPPMSVATRSFLMLTSIRRPSARVIGKMPSGSEGFPAFTPALPGRVGDAIRVRRRAMKIVDTHTHFVPLELVELVRSGQGPPDVSLGERDDGDPLIVHDNGLRYPVFPLFHDAEAKLHQMDRDGIDVALISLTPSLLLYWTDPGETARVHRIINDAGAALARRGQGRLHALATVPLNDPPAAAAELRRARRELGLVGVEIGTSVGETMLDDPSLEPFFAAAEELGMPVLVHPYTNMVSAPGPELQGFHLGNVIGNPFETFVAAARMIVGGVFDRHPDLRVQLVHAGGALPVPARPARSRLRGPQRDQGHRRAAPVFVSGQLPVRHGRVRPARARLPDLARRVRACPVRERSPVRYGRPVRAATSASG